MKVLAISGSRNPDGQTASAVAAFCDGVRAAGGEVEVVFLPELGVERCRQCDAAGWGECRSLGRCVIDDDFAAIVDRVRAADAVLVATPVYWGDLSESLRALLDRLRRITRHETGQAGLTGKPAIGLCVAGGGGGGAPPCTVSLERVLATCGFDVLDMIPARRQNLAMKREVLAIAGRWLVTEHAPTPA